MTNLPENVTPEMYNALLAKVQELEALEAKKKAKEGQAVTANGLTIRVAKSGGVSVYGLGRYPITQYAEQWLRLLEGSKEGNADAIRGFIESHKAELKFKPTEEEQAAA